MKHNIQQKLTPALIAILIFGSVLFTGTILYIEEYTTQKSQYKSLVEVSKAYSTSLQSFRDFYSKIILKQIHDEHIEITHDYINKKNAIPIPATMTIDLMSFLNNNNAKATLHLSSKYPFPWRESRKLSTFDYEALNYFETTSKDDYSQFKKNKEGSLFQYAVPIRMQQSCVSCHNSHPDSPKTDWKIGDLRGIQVIDLEPNVITVNDMEDRIYFIIVILLFFTFNISVILWLMQRNNIAFKQIIKDKVKITEALDSAKRANKAKDNFLANISHEVRTPLNAIIGFADILTASKLAQNEHEQAKIISTSAKSLLAIINDILDFSKMESGKFEIKNEPTSLQELAEHIYVLFNVKAQEKSIQLQYTYDENIPALLEFDSLRIQQVISNLLGNAIKFTPENKNIYFEIKLLEQEKNRAKIYFEIKDSGIGIPKDKQEHIFKPFSQADDSVTKQFGGTGLGLTIITKILEMMDSKIVLQSEENQGSTFSFTLDLSIAVQTEIPIEPIVENESVAISGKVLIAEDNQINQKLMDAMLCKHNISYEFANNGLEAIEAIKINTYDLIFMDINMPQCDGLEATKQIRAFEQENSLNSVPIVALTANAIKGDKEKYLDAGMNDYLDKPINVTKLTQALEYYLKDTTPTSNVNIIEKAIENLQLDEENIKLLIDNFFQSLPEDIKKLEEAIKEQDAHEIYQSAHYIKSAATNFGMEEAVAILEQMEIKSQCGESEGFEIEKLKSIFQSIQQQIN